VIVTRRTLVHATTASAVLAAPAALAAAIPAPTDPLIALCDRWRAAFADLTAACARQEIAEDAAIAARKSRATGLDLIEAAEDEAIQATWDAHTRQDELLDEIVNMPARS
jgi:hypothetical protein